MTFNLSFKRLLLAVGATALLVTAACGGGKDNEKSTVATDARPPANEEGALLGGDYDANAYNSADGERIGPAPASGGVAAPDTSEGGPSTQSGGTLPALLDRRMIMTATVTLETDKVSQRFEDVANIAAGAGGFVSSSSFGNSGEQQTASITIRIPSEGYQRALVELRKLGEVKGEQSGANDVTEEYTDLESRLRGLRAVEQQYMTFLERAVTVDEVLMVQDRLNGVRVEMEQIQGRINLLANQTDLATITVHLEPPAVVVEPPSDGGTVTPIEALENGWEASLAVLGGVAVVALAVLAFSWWLIPILILGAFIVRRFAKHAHSTAAVTAVEQAAQP